MKTKQKSELTIDDGDLSGGRIAEGADLVGARVHARVREVGLADEQRAVLQHRPVQPLQLGVARVLVVVLAVVPGGLSGAK